MNLQGKVILVTGASRGIGRAVATALVGEGASVSPRLAARIMNGLGFKAVARSLAANADTARHLPPASAA